MKTAEEWIPEMVAKYGVVRRGMTDTIKQIQLDAIKEGMRRAAGTCTNTYNTHLHYQTMDECRLAILKSAEQLTEKDLL